MSRRVVVADEARDEFSNQIDYLIAQGALQAAASLKQRFNVYLCDHLAKFPHTGTRIPERDLFEVWISGTRLVLWYRFTDDELVVLSVWHTSQDRSRSESD